MGATLSSFDRLSSREKALVLGLFGGVSALAVLIALVVVSSSLTELEEEIAFNNEMFSEIEDAVAPYRESMAKVNSENLPARVQARRKP